MTLRVGQRATGNIGTRALRQVIGHPDLSLAGLFAAVEPLPGPATTSSPDRELVYLGGAPFPWTGT
jgi:hypothetical protein